MTYRSEQSGAVDDRGYRADIDGLRAIAVLAVLCNHTYLKAPGGFVGVDIFFVISGYLISDVILRELQQERFSLASFYERRIRRIAPALVVLLIATTWLGYRYLPPAEFADYGRSVVAAVLSCSNILFQHQAGYFEDASRARPLLHTWSLAVEEQFYLVFPLLLMAIRRWMPRQMRSILLGLFCLSLIAACFWTRFDASAAFYQSPLRAWELLLGAIVCERYVSLPERVRSRSLAGALGLVMVFVAIFFYTEATPFPGLAAILPCVGAALLLASGEGEATPVTRLLSWRPLVFVGLISYSLYLWHWPLWLFQKSNLLLVDTPAGNSRAAKVAVVVASFVLATLSWLLVERPFRKGRWKPGRRALFGGALVAACVLIAVGTSAWATGGWPGRFTAEERSLAEIAAHDPYQEVRKGTCFLTSQENWRDFSPKVCLPKENRPKYLLIGDSTAAGLYPGIAAEFRDLAIWQVTASNCFLLDDPRVAAQGPNAQNCKEAARFVYKELLPRTHVDRVLLSVHWDEASLPALEKTVLQLKVLNQRVTLFGLPSEYDQPLGKLLFVERRQHHALSAGQHWVEANRMLDRKMKVLAQQWGVGYLSEFDTLCVPGSGFPLDPATGCPLIVRPGVPLKFDRFHYSIPGGEAFARRLRETGQLP